MLTSLIQTIASRPANNADWRFSRITIDLHEDSASTSTIVRVPTL